MASEGLHEPEEKLSQETIDQHRAFVSLMEELEAADWYNQRVDASTDPELQGILAHNRDEEKEHAAMLLEWLRRKDAKLDEELRNYLFTEKPILQQEEGPESEHGMESSASGGNGSLGIGSLRGKEQK